MRKSRTLFIGGLASAVVGVVMTPRAGDSRRAALARLQASLRRRGGLTAFAGTPCSDEDAARRSPEDGAGREGS